LNVKNISLLPWHATCLSSRWMSANYGEYSQWCQCHWWCWWWQDHCPWQCPCRMSGRWLSSSWNQLSPMCVWWWCPQQWTMVLIVNWQSPIPNARDITLYIHGWGNCSSQYSTDLQWRGMFINGELQGNHWLFGYSILSIVIDNFSWFEDLPCLPSLMSKWTWWPNRPSTFWVCNKPVLWSPPFWPSLVTLYLRLADFFQSSSHPSAPSKLPLHYPLLDPERVTDQYNSSSSGLVPSWLSPSPAAPNFLNVGLKICFRSFGSDL